ncbi:MAG: aminoglycoside 6-N-acetyltransferase [Verrucomicrobia bacterium]|nr:aminoglycoside 6-N-acetyltransferase [Verrucomicrobiota bacterium]
MLPTIAFRALARRDLEMLRGWLNRPEVYEWWGRHTGPGSLGGAGADAATGAEVAAKYGPEIDAPGTTHRFIIVLGGRGVGLIQWYDLRDFPDYACAIGELSAGAAGIDVLIGEPAAMGRGIGSAALEQFVRSIVFAANGIIRAVAGPATTNGRSIRAFEKAGFVRARDVPVSGKPVREAVMVRRKEGEPGPGGA